jgi:hypothetical protein
MVACCFFFVHCPTLPHQQPRHRAVVSLYVAELPTTTWRHKIIDAACALYPSLCVACDCNSDVELKTTTFFTNNLALEMKPARVATCNLAQWALDFDGNLARILESIAVAKAQGFVLWTQPSSQSVLCI